MVKILFFLATLFVSVPAFTQSDVVQWKFESKKIADKKYEVKLIALVKNSWHIYSTSTPDGGPLPTKVSFAKNPLTTIAGAVKEIGKLESKYEEVFEIDTRYYNNKVEFVQTVTLKGNAKTNITGTVEYMACNDEQCLPPKSVPFTIALN